MGSGAWLQGSGVEAWPRERAGGVARGRRRLSAGGRNQRCSFCGGHGAQSLASSRLHPGWSRLDSRTLLATLALELRWSENRGGEDTQRGARLFGARALGWVSRRN